MSFPNWRSSSSAKPSGMARSASTASQQLAASSVFDRWNRGEVSQERIKGRRETTLELQTRIAQLEVQATNRDRELGEVTHLLQKTDQRARNAEKRAQELQRDVETLTIAHNTDATLLAARAAELRDAQFYLSKTDSLSDEDIRHMLETLNATIFQYAAQFADDFPYDAITPLVNGTQDKETIRRKVKQWVAHDLVDRLETANDRLDPILVQITLQSGIASMAKYIIMRWTAGTHEENETLTSIHYELMRTEPWTVVTRWRSLTQRGAQQLDMQRVSYNIMSLIGKIMLLCGVDRGTDSTAITIGKYESRLQAIAKQITDLKKAMREDVLACEFMPHYVRGQEYFRPTTMEDSFGRHIDPTTEPMDRVFCTTELGLYRYESYDKHRGLLGTLLLRPKVVLLSALRELESSKPNNV
ncbi:hypothetical protein OBBRIDRAFT_826295 [Obba rivulosa]|uniref:Uncharacterized protein n=1 Tax=Obba rivulosa TaxID=1052685 RepID=A0A8E2DLH6_9APHY|nr:hypothetical protein OBBRIDRAFT_826295 [Obba rivulosa]